MIGYPPLHIHHNQMNRFLSGVVPPQNKDGFSLDRFGFRPMVEHSTVASLCAEREGGMSCNPLLHPQG